MLTQHIAPPRAAPQCAQPRIFEAINSNAHQPPSLPVHVRPSVKGIAQDVARRRGNVTVAEIFGRGRTNREAHARQEVMFHAREAGMSFPQIGRRFPSPSALGYMNHTSVIWAWKQHRKRMRAALLDRVALENKISARAHGGRS